jgi:adenylate cyclase class IV
VPILESKKAVLAKIKPEKAVDIVDIYYCVPEGRWLRVRDIFSAQEPCDNFIITCKKDFFRRGKWLYSQEKEFSVGPDIYEILKMAGLKELVRIKMTKYFYEGCEIQDVKNLGLFLEVEGKNRKEIWRRIKSLELKVGEESTIGKPEMMLRKMKKDNQFGSCLLRKTTNN